MATNITKRTTKKAPAKKIATRKPAAKRANKVAMAAEAGQMPLFTSREVEVLRCLISDNTPPVPVNPPTIYNAELVARYEELADKYSAVCDKYASCRQTLDRVEAAKQSAHDKATELSRINEVLHRKLSQAEDVDGQIVALRRTIQWLRSAMEKDRSFIKTLQQASTVTVREIQEYRHNQWNLRRPSTEDGADNQESPF